MSGVDIADARVLVLEPPSFGALRGCVGVCELSGAAGVYVPAPDFAGVDAFVVVVENTAVGSGLRGDAATVSVVVRPTNDAPRLGGDASEVVVVDEDSVAFVFLPGVFVDVDGDALSFSATAGAGVTATVIDDALLVGTLPDFVSPPGQPALVQVSAVDDDGATLSHELIVEVVAVDDAPRVSVALATAVGQGETLAGTLTLVDVDDEALSLSVSSPADVEIKVDGVVVGVEAIVLTPGTFALSAVAAVDAPPGQRALRFSVTAGALVGETSAALEVSEALRATARAVVVDEDTPTEIGLLGQGPPGFAFVIKRAPARGTLGALIGDAVLYTPASNDDGRDGDDAFAIAVSSAGLESAPVEITIGLRGDNDAPELALGRVLVRSPEDDDVDVDVLLAFGAFDVDGDVLATSVLSGGGDDVQLDDGLLSFAPAGDFVGLRRVLIAFDDVGGERVTGELELEIEAQNDTPVALASLDNRTAEDEAIVVFLDAFDVDDDVLIFAVTQPAHGTVDDALLQERGVVVYRPDPDFHGDDAFSFTAADAEGSAEAAVVVVVTPVNDPPQVISSVVRVGPAIVGQPLIVPVIVTASAPAVLEPGAIHVVDVDVAGDPGELADLDVLSTGPLATVSDRCGSLELTPTSSLIDPRALVFDDTLVLRPRDAVGPAAAAAVRVEYTSLPSCAHLLTSGISASSGIHLIDPQSAGGPDRFLGRCDMQTAGGGFTEVLRINGANDTFAFNSLRWSDGEVRADDGGADGVGEARSPAYVNVAVDDLLIRFSARTFTATLGGGARSSLHRALSENRTVDSEPLRAAVSALRWTGSDGVSCREGVGGAVRLGVSCVGLTAGAGLQTSGAGPTGGVRINSDAVVAASMIVSVRGRDFTDLPSRASCNGAALSGLYRVNNVVTACERGERRTVCGDGFEDEPGLNDCDDGDDSDGGRCRAACDSPNTCGDGVPGGIGEICDDGNNDDDDGCRPDCTPDCGDGEVDPGEDCDGDASCNPLCRTCGTGTCDAPFEDADNCSADCVCGDGLCQGSESDFEIGGFQRCAFDCGTCGDGTCGNGESLESCAFDCSVCGNGLCEGGESTPFRNCTQDCPRCGNGSCSSDDGETSQTCPTDCGTSCGDGVCNGDETAQSCSLSECAVCGDGLCSSNENSQNCCNDCGPSCGDFNCNCGEDSSCSQDCAAVIPFCGDGSCQTNLDNCQFNCTIEDRFNCPADCPPFCGDGVCDGNESLFSCRDDCGFCGDGTCDPSEGEGCVDCAFCGDRGGGPVCTEGERFTCPSDCPRCGNGVCESTVTSSEDCPEDCNGFCGDGRCNEGEEGFGCSDCVCGDGVCSPNEDGQSCGTDCGGCGDNILTREEECEPALFEGPCRDNCRIKGCGDGFVDAGEECDDGNGSFLDGCTPRCRLPRCGDAIIAPTEACDDGNSGDGDGCDSLCRFEACGNGLQQSGEACDDSNRTNGDGCDGNCAIEVCGNGVVQPGEQCDDGNDDDDDACSDSCVLARCGDGRVQSAIGEECDDANDAGGDGCGACRDEVCGNGLVQSASGEECDDDNDVDVDACTGCRFARCGDGFLQPASEACDDGNRVDEDGCSALCALERCGDGVLQAPRGETCDDSNTTAGDGCGPTCVLEGCGNGIVDAVIGEACDDANDFDCDGCNACQLE
ncbi:MAG: tandem-95 repeat protein [Deltaproteobacteria bacterium]|nr:tandem-95 repeat protein [Deltaproteobacteria bacterium]